ncbi:MULTISPECIES: hypothetical protein [Reichenbachiella]|uniref:Uncharacterized protein n=1 Tax=Reichenbachiella agariperforans TaxID=156994 RepID=A0A1M6VGC2_REIAG|nr:MULTISPECIES: hypothetical protein [Reichenbachiella]RJE75269.1 hypothetical protein BGP76_19435 [Reichenbachiella sp. MSK19-1]SHK80587.1 hypothetical protein SAMN04488028_10940 [Reichenbachiella agariperforans]
MINIRHILNISAVGAIAILATACGGEKKKSQGELDAQAEVFEKAEHELIEEIDKVVHDMPPPSEVPYLLMATGADFNGDIINSTDNASKYFNSADKAAMNLGAYATDIGYLSSYDQVQDALTYMETSQKLADQIGISSAFELDLMERFEKNLGNKDSLANLINYSMEVAEKKLEETDRLQMVALVLSGSYIEGLYLSVMVLDTYPEDLLPAAQRDLILEPIVRVIIDQKKSLDDIIHLLKDLESDPIIADVIAEFDILKELYKEDVGDIDQRIADQDPTLKLDKALLIDIITEVKRIRGDMVK